MSKSCRSLYGSTHHVPSHPAAWPDDASGIKITNIEPGDTRTRQYSLAFDIGTTGVRGQLLDLKRGNVIASAIEYNKQISYGEDVISRIIDC